MKQLALVALMASTLVGCGEYSDGERVGTIQKFSRKGLIAKTWEGEMLLGGLKRKTVSGTDSNGGSTSSTSMVANVFEFTVEDPALIEKVRSLIERGVPVRVHYRQEYITHPFRSDNSMFFGPHFLTAATAAE